MERWLKGFAQNRIFGALFLRLEQTFFLELLIRALIDQATHLKILCVCEAHAAKLLGLQDMGTCDIFVNFAFTLEAMLGWSIKIHCLEDEFCSIFGV